MNIRVGCCVKLNDRRIGRVREKTSTGLWKVRVKRFTSDTHQFLYLKRNEMKVVKCPQGWMSIDGYNRYVKKTLAKMKERLRKIKKE